MPSPSSLAERGREVFEKLVFAGRVKECKLQHILFHFQSLMKKKNMSENLGFKNPWFLGHRPGL